MMIVRTKIRKEYCKADGIGLMMPNAKLPYPAMKGSVFSEIVCTLESVH